MNTTVQIDKAGRLVVPKPIREALHLAPGIRLVLHQEGSRLILERDAKPRGLYRENALLVYDCGLSLPPDHVDWVEQSRDERAEELWMQAHKE